MKQKSFTLIELLVVIAIIGFLASVVLVSTGGVRRQAKIAKVLEFHQSVQHILGAYAVGWWSFESIEPGNKVLDGSGYGNDGTVNGATLVVGLDKLGNALSFDGVNDNVTIPGIGNQSEVTVSYWAKFNNITFEGIFIKRGSGTTGWFWFYRTAAWPAGRIAWYPFWTTTGGGWSANQCYISGLQTGTWYHIVGIISSSGAVSCYVNGALSESWSVGSSFSKVGANASTGSESANIGNSVLNGLIDEVRIYERALSVAEIKKHYTEGLKTHSLVLE